jgi:hypothetical protein
MADSTHFFVACPPLVLIPRSAHHSSPSTLVCCSGVGASVASSAPSPPSDSRKAWGVCGVSALARELSSWPGRNVIGCAATIRGSRHGALAVPHASTPRPRLPFFFGCPDCSQPGMQFLCLSERLSLDDSVCAFLALNQYLARDHPVASRASDTVRASDRPAAAVALTA